MNTEDCSSFIVLVVVLVLGIGKNEFGKPDSKRIEDEHEDEDGIPAGFAFPAQYLND
jgi:hypothetical protein